MVAVTGQHASSCQQEPGRGSLTLNLVDEGAAPTLGAIRVLKLSVRPSAGRTASDAEYSTAGDQNHHVDGIIPVKHDMIW